MCSMAREVTTLLVLCFGSGIFVLGANQQCSTFGNDLIQATPSNAKRLFANVSGPVTCSGNATSWDICFYVSTTDYSTTKTHFGVYRPTSADSTTYNLVQGSPFAATVDGYTISRDVPYQCKNFSISPQNQFIVYSGDILVVCVQDPDSLGKLGIAATIRGATVRTSTPFGGCSSLPASPLDLLSYTTSSDVTLHVRLAVNECALNNGGCQQICADRNPGHSCGCYNGYQLAANGLNCTYSLSSSTGISLSLYSTPSNTNPPPSSSTSLSGVLSTSSPNNVASIVQPSLIYLNTSQFEPLPITLQNSLSSSPVIDQSPYSTPSNTNPPPSSSTSPSGVLSTSSPNNVASIVQPSLSYLDTSQFAPLSTTLQNSPSITPGLNQSLYSTPSNTNPPPSSNTSLSGVLSTSSPNNVASIVQPSLSYLNTSHFVPLSTTLQSQSHTTAIAIGVVITIVFIFGVAMTTVAVFLFQKRYVRKWNKDLSNGFGIHNRAYTDSDLEMKTFQNTLFDRKDEHHESHEHHKSHEHHESHEHHKRHESHESHESRGEQQIYHVPRKHDPTYSSVNKEKCIYDHDQLSRSTTEVQNYSHLLHYEPHHETDEYSHLHRDECSYSCIKAPAMEQLSYSHLHKGDNTEKYNYSYCDINVKNQKKDQDSQVAGFPVYSKVINKPAVRDIGENLYYAPASQEPELYVQLENQKVLRIKIHEIEITDASLGSGHFGEVQAAVWNGPKGRNEVAIKTLNPSSSKPEDKIKFLQEAAIMAQFKHPNVIQLYGIVTDSEPVMLVLELASNKDLSMHLGTMRPKALDDNIKTELPKALLGYSKQIAHGMHYLSSKSFVHRDLAARNVLVTKDCICKIADFGMSRDLADNNYYVSHGGLVPVKWTAPEAVHFMKYSTSSDVWSYGCLLYEIWSLGHKPFEGLTSDEALQKVDAGYRLPPPPACPLLLYQIMIKCWNPDAHLRPTFGDVYMSLSLDENVVLAIPKEVHPEADFLGAPLEAGNNMYPDLQKSYN